MIKKLIFLIALIIPCFVTFSQPLQGHWHAYVPFFKAYSIADAGNIIYCAEESGIMAYNTETQEIKTYTKVDGLSDVEVSTIAYSATQKKLIIGYNNGNIDLINEDGSLTNLPDIKRKSLVADKNIYRIIIYGNMAYLCCGFGIVAVDLSSDEFIDTYMFGENGVAIKVNDVLIDNDTIYAATKTGIYKVSLKSPNLVDYHFWKRITYIPQFDGEYRKIDKFNGKYFGLYHDSNSQKDRIITYGNNQYQFWDKKYDTVVNSLSVSNGYLAVSGNSSILIYDQNEQLHKEISNVSVFDTYMKSNGDIFMASHYNGFTFYNQNGILKYLLIDSPRWRDVSKIASLDDQVWVSSGGPQNNYVNGAAYSFIDRKWNSYDGSKIETKNPLGNTYKIAIDPRDPSHVYVGTYLYGLIEFQDGDVKHIYQYGDMDLFSDIPAAVGIRIMGMQFDSHNNLWMVFDLIPQPIFKINSDGTWERPRVSGKLLTQENTTFSDLLVTESDQIWLSTYNAGLIVLQNDGSDNFQYKNFLVKNQDGDVIPKANCLKEDHNGDIWVGTNSGPVIYYNPSRVFDLSDVSGYQVKIPRNDGTSNADFLLFSESILDIAVDGANRKWFATGNSGVFLVSDDAKETLLNFREENSPLFSNSVSGVGINQKTGEVFFATSLGLISYRGTATGGQEGFNDVYVYPNPVREDYEGPITITGLMENSNVKITDISGNLVYETTSLGGQAIWDGKNFSGHRVATGVYLVMLASEDGTKSYVTKLLFIH